MDPAVKKRKSDENGAAAAPAALTPDDVAKILAPFTPGELTSVITSALVSGDPAVLAAVRAVADRDPSQRKLFIRGLGCDTTADSLRAVFSPFGDLDEAVVITDKATARSKGYGFLTFRHADSAVLALRNPSKQIDGRITVTNLASAGNTTAAAATSSLTPTPAADRKLFVGNVPADMSSDRLLSHFSTYGEIEEGPLGFDKQTGKFRGYALFVYKEAEAARAALVEPNKTIDGVNMVCKLANADSKKGKPAAPPVEGGMPGQYVIPGSGGLSGGYTHPVGAGISHQVTTSMPSFNVGAPGFGSVYGPSSQYGAQGSGGYGGVGPSLQYGAQGSGGYGGVGSSLYRMPPGLGGMPTAGQAEGAQYPLPAPGQYSLPASAYQSQHLQPTGSPGRRYPIGGPGYPSLPSTLPPYF